MWMHVLHGEKKHINDSKIYKPAQTETCPHWQLSLLWDKKKKKLQVVGDTSPDLESSATF